MNKTKSIVDSIPDEISEFISCIFIWSIIFKIYIIISACLRLPGWIDTLVNFTLFIFVIGGKDTINYSVNKFKNHKTSGEQK